MSACFLPRSLATVFASARSFRCVVSVSALPSHVPHCSLSRRMVTHRLESLFGYSITTSLNKRNRRMSLFHSLAAIARRSTLALFLVFRLFATRGRTSELTALLAPAAKDLSHVPCKFFKVDACTAGAACPFSHSLGDPGRPKDVCAWFIKGNCKVSMIVTVEC